MGLGAQQLNQRPTNGTGTVIVATPQNTIQHLPTQIAGEVRAAALNIPGEHRTVYLQLSNIPNNLNVFQVFNFLNGL